jgi:GDP-L-fucose synthase
MAVAEKCTPLAGKKVWVAGHTGMVGQALCRRLQHEDCTVLTVPRATLDLRNQAATAAWVQAHAPDFIFIAAGTVGGIQANASRPAEFIYDNAAIVSNIIAAAHKTGTTKVMAIGSSCMYPRLAPQPMREDTLMTGELEPTNVWFATAKLLALKMAQAYRAQYGMDIIMAIPTNLFGPGDNFDPAASHVVPAMIRKVQDAKAHGGAVQIWGTGTPRREFLLVDDAADAMVFLMERYSKPAPINIGCGEDVSILELAQRVAAVVGYTGDFETDPSKPDGMPLKRLDATEILALGWAAKTTLDDGLRTTVRWFQENQAHARV